MASVATAISSWSFSLNMAGTRSLGSISGEHSLFRQFFQAQPNKLRRLRVLTRTARGGGDGSRRLRLAVAEIDQRRDRIGDRARRAVIVDGAGKMHHGRIDIGERRRLVFQFRD